MQITISSSKRIYLLLQIVDGDYFSLAFEPFSFLITSVSSDGLFKVTLQIIQNFLCFIRIEFAVAFVVLGKKDLDFQIGKIRPLKK